MSKTARRVLRFIAVIAFGSSFLSCPGLIETPESGKDVLDQPVISPAGGRFSDAILRVTMSGPEGGRVFWTDDGSEPTAQSNLYGEAFYISNNLTLRAIAIQGEIKSAVTSATFTLRDGVAPNSLGIVKGRVALPAEFVAASPTGISVFIKELPGIVKRPDANGFFFFDGLDTSQTYTFVFTDQEVGTIRGSAVARGIGGLGGIGVVVGPVTPSAGAGLSLGEVFMKKLGRIKGQALMYNRTGQLAADHTGIDVYAPGTSFSARTAADGSFTLAFIPEGRYTLRAERPGYTFQQTTDVYVQADEETDLSAAALRIYYGSGTVTGTVQLKDGSAGAIASDGVSILLKHLADPSITVSATSAIDGSFALGGVEPGQYAAFFAKAGYLSAQVSQIAVLGATVNNIGLTYLRVIGGRVNGTVKLSAATDHAGIIIVANDPTSGKNFSTATLANGSFTLDPILPGTYDLIASRAGYSTRTLSGLIVPSGGDTASAVFEDLYPAVGTIGGTASLESGSDFSGILVSAQKSDDATVVKTAVTGATGAFVLSDVKPGTYLISFSKTGFLAGSGTSATLVGSGIATAPDYELASASARVSGYARLDGTADYSGIGILAAITGGASYTTLTDASGRFSIVGMAPGTYSVHATKDGYTAGQGDAMILGAGAACDDIALQLAVSTRSLIGQVTLEGQTVHAGIKISATNLADITKIYSALTNNEGRFAMAGMTPGNYLVSYSHDNHKGITAGSVALAATSLAELPAVILERARGAVAGIVLLEGRTAHAGTTVSLVGTTYTTTAAVDGSYNLLVPAGNYPGGIRFDMVDFQSTMITGTITVLIDGAFGVAQKTLTATHNTLRGSVDLLGSPTDGGIAVSIEGLTGFSSMTAADGSWSFDHVPVGTYTVKLSRADTPDVTCLVTVAAGPGVSLPRLDMIPNASGLKGYIKLAGMGDHSGVRVTVTTEDKPNQTALSNASGFFEIGNILSTGSHTVSASKAGWGARTMVISDFVPLETRTIGQTPEIVLSDTTAPVFAASSGVLLNEGGNFTDNKNLRVALSLSEQGSGPFQMQVQLNSSPAEPNWEPFLGLFNRDLAGFYTYTGNGEYTVSVRVKDRAGNISAWAADAITLTSQRNEITGPLGDAQLHWTKANSPYLLMGNVRVGVGKTLTIDPGVEVRAAGDYYIESYGTVNALGTSADPIVFAKDAGYSGTWSQLFIFKDEAPTATCDAAGNWLSGSLFHFIRSNKANFTFSGTSDRFYAADALLSFAGTLAGSVAGIHVRNTIDGPAAGTFIDCVVNGPASGIFKACEITQEMPSGTISDSTIHDVYSSGSGSGSLKNSVLYSIWVNSGFSGTIENVLVDTANDLGLSGTITGLTVRNVRNLAMDGIIAGSRFENVSQNITFSSTTSSVTESAFSDCGMLVSAATWAPASASISLRGNYFGAAATQELDARGTAINKSFTRDYWDDITKAELDVSGYLTSALVNVGYQGTIYIGPDIRDSIGSTLVFVPGGASSSIPNGTVNGSWSVSDFSVGRYEITQAQYAAVMGTNPAYFKGDLNRPVESISWYGAVEFCNRLSIFAGLAPAYTVNGTDVTCDWTAAGYRLPTEAEWEWAARGGTASQGYTYAGGNSVEDVAWIPTNSDNTTHSVGGKLPNELGLYDMSGNVWEWVWDWNVGSMTSVSMTGANPTGAVSGTKRNLRGGAWYDAASHASVSYRYNYFNHTLGYQGTYGFRVVRP